MSATYARKKPFLRFITAVVATVAAPGMAVCSGGASTSSSFPSSAQVGDRSPEQTKEAGKIVIDTLSDKAPFGYIDADGKPTGYDTVYGDRIAADLGVTAKCASADAVAYTEVLASNKVDITPANFTVTPEHAEEVDFASLYSKISPGIVSPTSVEITDVNQLAGETLIITKGTIAEAYFEANRLEVKFQKYDQHSDTYQALEDGRGDALSTDNTEAIAQVIQHPGLSVGIKSLGEVSYIMAAVKRDNTALLDWLNNQFAEFGQENFFHRDYEQTLASVCGDVATPDDPAIEGGVGTTSTN